MKRSRHSDRSSSTPVDLSDQEYARMMLPVIARNFEVSDLSDIVHVETALLRRVLPHMSIGVLAETCVRDRGLLDILRGSGAMNERFRLEVMKRVIVNWRDDFPDVALPPTMLSVDKNTLMAPLTHLKTVLGSDEYHRLLHLAYPCVCINLRDTSTTTTTVPSVSKAVKAVKAVKARPMRKHYGENLAVLGLSSVGWEDAEWRTRFRRAAYVVEVMQRKLLVIRGTSKEHMTRMREATHAVAMHVDPLPDMPDIRNVHATIAMLMHTALITSPMQCISLLPSMRFLESVKVVDMPVRRVQSVDTNFNVVLIYVTGDTVLPLSDPAHSTLTVPEFRLIMKCDKRRDGQTIAQSFIVQRRLPAWTGEGGDADAGPDDRCDSDDNDDRRRRAVDPLQDCIEAGGRCTWLNSHNTRLGIDVYPFLSLLDVRPLDALRSLPQTSSVNHDMWAAAHAWPVPVPNGLAPAPSSAHAPGASKGEEGKFDDAFLRQCTVLETMMEMDDEDDRGGNAGERAVALLLESPIANVQLSELLMLQTLSRMPWDASALVGLHADVGKADDLMMQVVSSTLPSPCPVVRLLSVANYLGHCGAIDRCIAILVVKIRTVSPATVVGWW